MTPMTTLDWIALAGLTMLAAAIITALGAILLRRRPTEWTEPDNWRNRS